MVKCECLRGSFLAHDETLIRASHSDSPVKYACGHSYLTSGELGDCFQLLNEAAGSSLMIRHFRHLVG